MADSKQQGVYGEPPTELADVAKDAVQFSPLMPGAAKLEERHQDLAALAMLAPPGTIERRYTLALALKALMPGGRFTVMAPVKKGGARLVTELEGFGLEVSSAPRRHHRVCEVVVDRPLSGIDEAIADGAPRIVPDLGLWSQPGAFAFDRVDPGTAALIEVLPLLEGRGADLGCGIGFLARAVLPSPLVTALTLVDIDRRAVECAEHNVVDARASFLWADVRTVALPEGLDFVVMNPPFHDGGAEDRALGQAFIRRAAGALRRGGRAFVTANRHLPYEDVLKASFKVVRVIGDADGYKLFEAIR
ncbi:MAG TPA: methyltransferase [Kaistia sp.]|nr:methyltransferase [Kaistia sp.]